MSKYSFRVYYEDTDAGGVVYYANYLKFAERARTEFLRTAGINQSELAQKNDVLFVVRNVQMDLLKPARLDDMLDVITTVEKIGGASIIMNQQIFCNANILVNVRAIIASVASCMKPVRIPEEVRSKIIPIASAT
ncbi:MAG: ybgC [Rickettsiaceae bacterium]|jgi:acyl-CoA thioester hydrolase|nr:ybgC [Rickettsiaceae bacterium]